MPVVLHDNEMLHEVYKGQLIGYRLEGRANQLSGLGCAMTAVRVEDLYEWLALFQGVYLNVSITPIVGIPRYVEYKKE